MSTSDVRRLVIRNHLAELRRLAVWVERWAQGGVPPNSSFALQLCLEEAVANVIMYGATDGELKIAIELERRDRTLVAELKTMANPSIRLKFHHVLYRARSRMRRLVILASILCVALRAKWIMNDVMVTIA
jgi:two-component sensor histidine kinase